LKNSSDTKCADSHEQCLPSPDAITGWSCDYGADDGSTAENSDDEGGVFGTEIDVAFVVFAGLVGAEVAFEDVHGENTVDDAMSEMSG
jgi:hypothetical protein